MKHGFIKVKAVTPTVAVADCATNAQNIIAEIAKASEEKVNLLVFPQLCVTGYSAGDLIKSGQIKSASEKALCDIAKATKNTNALVFVGSPVYNQGKIYNCAVAIFDGRILAVIPKTYLTDNGGKSESRVFAPAPEFDEEICLCGGVITMSNRVVLTAENMPEFSVAVELGDEIFAPVSPAVYSVLGGAKVVVNLCAIARAVNSTDRIFSAVVDASKRLNCGYVLSNAGLGESTTDFVYCGNNIIAQSGKILSSNDNFENGSLISELELESLGVNGYGSKSVKKVFFSVNKAETKLTLCIDKNPFFLTDDECKTALNIQAYGLKKRMEHTKIKKAVIGVSGGLDSTLALLALDRAFSIMNLPPSNIIAVTMPCFGTSNRTKSNADKLIEIIGATYRQINISNSVSAHLNDIGHDGVTADATFENAQARERTQVLMDIANTENALVIGTGDLSELALGWATYNGDHMSNYALNGSICKTAVRRIVTFVAQNCENESMKEVLIDIVDTPVSPELLPPTTDGEIAQKTEEKIGPYELHDFYLYHMLKNGFGADKIYRMAVKAFEGEYGEETIYRWLKTFLYRFFSQQFKRSCLPDGVAISEVGVSPRGTLSMPSDAVVSEWITALDNYRNSKINN